MEINQMQTKEEVAIKRCRKEGPTLYVRDIYDIYNNNSKEKNKIKLRHFIEIIKLFQDIVYEDYINDCTFDFKYWLGNIRTYRYNLKKKNRYYNKYSTKKLQDSDEELKINNIKVYSNTDLPLLTLWLTKNVSDKIKVVMYFKPFPKYNTYIKKHVDKNILIQL